MLTEPNRHCLIYSTPGQFPPAPTQRSLLTYNTDKKFLKENMYCFKLSDVPDVNVSGRRPNVRAIDERFASFPIGTRVVLYTGANFTGQATPLIKFGTFPSPLNVRSIMIDSTKARKGFVLCKDDAGTDCSLPIKHDSSTRSAQYDAVKSIFSVKKKVERTARVIPGAATGNPDEARTFFQNLFQQAANRQRNAAGAAGQRAGQRRAN
jgi:hypothetical protein